jgi:hypothetical protein
MPNQARNPPPIHYTGRFNPTRSSTGLHPENNFLAVLMRTNPERKFQTIMRALAVSIICHLSAWQAAAGIAIAGYREFPSGLIGITLTEGGVTQSMEMTWGQASAETGSKGPVVGVRMNRNDSSRQFVEVDDNVTGRLFTQATQVITRYGLPIVSTSVPKSADFIQIRMGYPGDPLWLNYPKSEPARWNQALELWRAMERVVSPKVPSKLMRPEPMAVAGGLAPQPGIGTLAEYTNVRILLTRVIPSKSQYESINISWQKSNDGRISFGGTWYPRIGDSLKAAPEAKAIPDIHKQLQSMLRSYRLVMPSSKGKQNSDRSHERFEMSVMVGDHPGEMRLTYFESDASQWSNAQAMWKIARELFPADDREKISK